jgi:polar amino acid transport system substrate-binding protein
MIKSIRPITREFLVNAYRTLDRLFAAGVVLAVTALVATSCGSSSSSKTPAATASPSASPVSSIAAEVPAAIKSKGALVVAADATYAPNEFIASDGHTVIGWDADLAKALGQVLGLKVSMVNATFDTIIPGLASGKYDLGMSSFTDTKVREKTVDFVDYYEAGTSFFVKSSGGPNITSLSDLCGHKVSVEKGTTEQTDAQAQAAKCKSAGKPTVTVEIFNDQNAANLALSSGRADVAMADSPPAAYQVKLSNGTFKLSGPAYGTAPYGIAIPKNNGMSKPILDALKQLMANGTYLKILEKWGVQAGAISAPAINGATS